MSGKPGREENRQAASSRLGPGHLVLVVGPSGAGKDTVLALVREAMRDDDTVVIPRRVVTRVFDGAEDHDTLSEAAFEQAIADRAFAVWWSAHGHKYAIPSSAEDAIRAGRTVICNVSRAVVQSLRQRFCSVTVVLVTAPLGVLKQRLAARNRSSDGDLMKRIARGETGFDESEADAVIVNVDTPQVAVAQLLDVIGKSSAL